MEKQAVCLYACARPLLFLPSFPALLFSLCVLLALSLPSCSAGASAARSLIPICALQPKHGELAGWIRLMVCSEQPPISGSEQPEWPPRAACPSNTPP